MSTEPNWVNITAERPNSYPGVVAKNRLPLTELSDTL